MQGLQGKQLAGRTLTVNVLDAVESYVVSRGACPRNSGLCAIGVPRSQSVVATECRRPCGDFACADGVRISEWLE